MITGMALLSMAGQARALHERGTIYVSPVLAHWMAYQSANQTKDGFIWGARAGVDITNTIGLEVFGLQGLTEIDDITDRLIPDITTINGKYRAYGLGMRFNVPGFGRYVPFLSVSGGQARLTLDAPITSMNYAKVDVEKVEKRNLLVVGAGADVMLVRNLALRFDIHDHYINKDFITGEPRGVRKTHNWEFGAGFTLLFGGSEKAVETRLAEAMPGRVDTLYISRPAEVPERPMTPPVQWMDSDGDGVPDNMDKCPGTPYGTPVDLNGCPKTLPEQYEIMALFDFDKSEIKPEFTQALDELARLLIKTGDRLSVTGYADQVGTKDYNVKLSDRRAHAVRDYLIAKGLPVGRLELKAFGEYPVDTSGNPVAYYQRCVQFKLIK